MGAYLSTDIANPSVLIAGGVLSGNCDFVAPAIGFYYAIVEQYNRELALIPGSRAFLHQSVAAGPFVNSTLHYTVVHSTAVGQAGIGAVQLTLANTDCYVWVSVKRITAFITAGAFVVGTTYKILTIGTTDFTLVGAAANTVGVEFVATGVGVGTGTVCVTPDPDVDETIDYVDVTLLSSAPATTGIDLSEIMNLMITMMIVMMMMKMMVGMMAGV